VIQTRNLRGSTPLSWTTAACPVGKQATSHARRSVAREGTARRAWGPPVVSRVKTIMAMAMAMTWSIATTACMFTQGYSHLLVAGLARAFVGLGEAGYGSVGAAMVSTHFPLRMRARVLGGFFASASVGSVLGVILGGMIASRYGWRGQASGSSAFGASSSRCCTSLYGTTRRWSLPMRQLRRRSPKQAGVK
jgi:MFS family permease